MSTEEKLNAIIPLTKKEYDDKNYVAILGYSSVGKTVLITLLSNALDKYFSDKHPDIDSRITSGDIHLKKWENNMLEGKFPKRTEILDKEEIIINMRGTGATASTPIDIRFPDISGEDFKNLCIGNDSRGGERVFKVFDMAKLKGQSYGEKSYIPYAKMYFILLDCSKLNEWEKDALDHAQALETILECKRTIKQTKYDKVDVPIGIVLTKADTLPDPDVDPRQLIHERMRRFENALKSIHSGSTEFFKVHVDVERNEDNEIDTTEQELRIPLTYSHDQYADILWWIHQNISG